MQTSGVTELPASASINGARTLDLAIPGRPPGGPRPGDPGLVCRRGGSRTRLRLPNRRPPVAQDDNSHPRRPATAGDASRDRSPNSCRIVASLLRVPMRERCPFALQCHPRGTETGLWSIFTTFLEHLYYTPRSRPRPPPPMARCPNPAPTRRSFRTRKCCCCTTCRAAARSRPIGRALPGRSKACSSANRWRHRSHGVEVTRRRFSAHRCRRVK